MYNGGHMFGFGWGFIWIFWILVLVAVIWLVETFTDNGSNQQQNAKSAEDILKERYVKGEIDREEFKQKRKNLND